MLTAWYSPSDAPALALVLTLGHTLWQALLVTIILWLVLRRLPASQTEARYGACAIALATVVLGALITAALLTTSPRHNHTITDMPQTTSAESTAPTASAPLPHTAIAPSAHNPLETPQFPAPQPGRAVVSPHPWVQSIASWLVLLWAAGALMMLMRLFASVRGADRLKQSGDAITDATVLRVFDDVRRAMNIARTVSLRVTSAVAVPVVIGVFRPVILLPISYLSGISPDVLRAVLAHELAHIRRYDYVVNLGQMLIEALLFFNPCVWWISAQLRAEREACCDKIAVNAVGNAHAYATALAQAAAMHVPGTAMPATAMALSDRPTGGLLNRVRRILFPSNHPHMRMPWYSLLGSMITWVALLAGLWTGSLAGVVLAKALTSHERMELIEQTEEQYGVPPTHGVDSFDSRTTVSGTLRLSDGRQPDKSTVIKTISQTPRLASGGNLTVRDGIFEGVVVAGQVHMAVGYPGYAPKLAGPYDLEPDIPFTGLDFTLEPGYRSEIHITDSQDQPLPDIQVQVRYTFPDKLNPLYTEEITSNRDGLAIIDHATTHPAIINISAPGFEPVTREIDRLPHEQPLIVKMRPAQVTTGTVINAATGQPIADAALMLATTRGPQGNSFGTLTTATVTNASGTFTLDNLRDDTRYDFLVVAPPHRPAWLANISAGDTSLRVEMGEPLVLRGTVSGRPEKARSTTWFDRIPPNLPAIVITDWLTYPNGTYTYPRTHVVPLQIQNGIGNFSAEGLMPGRILVMWDAGTPKQLELELHESLHDLKLSTESGEGTGTEWTRQPPPEEGTTRAVVLRFAIPEGAPPPGGTMRLNYKGLPGDPNSAQHSPIPVTGTEMRFVLETPSGISYAPGGTLGYWFEDGRIQVQSGEDEYVHEIRCHPAGSISGIARNAEGKPLKGGYVGVRIVKKPLALHQKNDLTPDTVTVNNEGRFHITPLPLGGTYQVVVSRDNYYVTTDKIPLTESAPIRSVTAQLGEGVTLEGQVVNEDQNPISGISVRLTLKAGESIRSVLHDQLTDRDGRFRIQGLNPDLSGAYTLELESRKSYQPTAVTAVPGQEPLRITLERGHPLHGRVVNEKTGEPLRGVTVFAVPPRVLSSLPNNWVHLLAEAPTDTDGRFQFSNLPDGELKLGVRGVGTFLEAIAPQPTNNPIELKVRVPEGMLLDAVP